MERDNTNEKKTKFNWKYNEWLNAIRNKGKIAKYKMQISMPTLRKHTYNRHSYTFCVIHKKQLKQPTRMTWLSDLIYVCFSMRWIQTYFPETCDSCSMVLWRITSVCIIQFIFVCDKTIATTFFSLLFCVCVCRCWVVLEKGQINSYWRNSYWTRVAISLRRQAGFER